jgi:hypothetical protein
MSNSEQEQYQNELAAIDHHIAMGEAWNRLQRNGDFKKIITNGYLKDKVLASASLLAVPQIQAEGRRAAIMEDIIAASNLGYFFKMIEMQYEGAKNPILSDEERVAFEEAQAEEAAGGIQ